MTADGLSCRSISPNRRIALSIHPWFAIQAVLLLLQHNLNYKDVPDVPVLTYLLSYMKTSGKSGRVSGTSRDHFKLDTITVVLCFVCIPYKQLS
jgi:hypothetical protein